MGFSGIGIWELFIILMIILLLFGTKRLRSIGTDLGSAFKGFRNALRDEEPSSTDEVHNLEHKPEPTNKTEDFTQKTPDDANLRVKSSNGIK